MSDQDPIVIDGRQGEGGGQVLRTSLALAVALGRPVRIENVRAGRAKPGLQRQHLACVLAAAEVSGGEVLGAEFRSTCVELRPSGVGAPLPGSDFGNLVKFVEVATKVQADGGDLRATMARWAEMLQGSRGLEPLANQARTLARAK